MKWSDGKPFSAADVAFTFNLIKKFPALNVPATPIPASATGAERDHDGAHVRAAAATPTCPDPADPDRAAAHLVVGRATRPPIADPNPVGTGPYVLDKFSPQGFT